MIATAFTVLSRLAIFTLLWLPLAGTRVESPVIGALAILAASVSSLLLWPQSGLYLRWRNLPPLVCHFFVHSLLGGIDVARRAFSRSMPLEPAFLHYQTSIRSEAGRVLFIWVIGMMPGTASVDLQHTDRITVHVIDIREYNESNLRRIEQKIAAVFDR